MAYHIAAVDGDIGHVEDFLMDEETWSIRYMVVDTHNWWFGKKVLVSSEWITGVDGETEGGAEASVASVDARPTGRSELR